MLKFITYSDTHHDHVSRHLCLHVFVVSGTGAVHLISIVSFFVAHHL